MSPIHELLDAARGTIRGDATEACRGENLGIALRPHMPVDDSICRSVQLWVDGAKRCCMTIIPIIASTRLNRAKALGGGL